MPHSPDSLLRVVLDLRPLQDPDRAPVTAAYLRQLLQAFAADPRPGEQFVVLLESGAGDPTESMPDLPVIARRRLPPTRLLRAGGLTLDPFLLRGAALGASWRAHHSTVYHVVGAALPLASGLPIVSTLLDLAPWELPATYQASPAARFGERLRARMLQDAAAVLVGTQSVARSAGRHLHIHADRIRVVPPAADADFADVAAVAEADPRSLAAAVERERGRLGLPETYLVFFGRFDARSDVPTLFDALALLRNAPRPAELAATSAWPPALLLVGASPDDRAAFARLADRRGVSELLTYAPYSPATRTAVLVAGARAAIIPAMSDAAGLTAIDALACGTPVVASAVGALPEVVGSAGILVEPAQAVRLARALRAVCADDATARMLREAAIAARSAARRWTWADVAAATRDAYLDAVRHATRRDR